MNETKIHPDLKRVMATADPDEEIPVIVRFRREPGVLAAQRVMPSSMSLVATYQTVPAAAAEGTRENILDLADSPNVERIWFDMPVHTMLDQSIPVIGVSRLWSTDLLGHGIKIGILDTGCDQLHSDLQERIKGQQDFTGKGTVQDGNGHGTHVASIIAGSGSASGGRYRGVAPEAELYIAKVLDDRGGGRTSGVISGLEWALEQGVHIVNLSLGSDISCDGTDALSEACDAAVAEGLVVVVAAGNSGPNDRTVGSPGCAHEVITIGASTDDDAVTSFSSRGPTLDGRVKPDVVLPGYKIIAARARDTSLGRVIDDNYVELSGTSMATPHASGVVALLLEAEPDLSPSDIKDRLQSTANDLGLDANTQGSGRVDAYAAWQLGQEPEPEPEPEPTPEPTPEPEPTPTPEPTPEPPATGGCFLSILSAFTLF